MLLRGFTVMEKGAVVPVRLNVTVKTMLWLALAPLLPMEQAVTPSTRSCGTPLAGVRVIWPAAAL